MDFFKAEGREKGGCRSYKAGANSGPGDVLPSQTWLTFAEQSLALCLVAVTLPLVAAVVVPAGRPVLLEHVHGAGGRGAVAVLRQVTRAPMFSADFSRGLKLLKKKK